jgi:hypothetical protein
VSVLLTYVSAGHEIAISNYMTPRLSRINGLVHPGFILPTTLARR